MHIRHAKISKGMFVCNGQKRHKGFQKNPLQMDVNKVQGSKGDYYQ